MTLAGNPHLHHRVPDEIGCGRVADAAGAQSNLGVLEVSGTEEDVFALALPVEVHRLEPAVHSRTGEHDECVRRLDRLVDDQVPPGARARERAEEDGADQAQQDQPRGDRSCAFEAASSRV